MYTYEVQKTRNEPKCWHGSALIRPATALGRDFCMETSMHGFRHIAEPRRHWSERLLWVAATSLAIWGAIDVSLGQLKRYNESPTVVILEKDFRSWRFSFPAVTACSKNRTDPAKLEEVIKDTWGVEPSDEKYEYYHRFVQVVTDSDILHLDKFMEFKDDQDLDVDLYQLAVDVLPEVDIKTTISESVFLKWIPVMTEAGACYSINSLAIGDVALMKLTPNHTMMYPITCKYGVTLCFMLLEVNSFYDFHYHSPYDVMDITEPASKIFLGVTQAKSLSVTETRCGRGVKELNPSRRACLFTDEPTSGRKVFSTNSCQLSCRSKIALDLCGCRPFYYFYEGGPICTPAGMACLAEHAERLSSRKGLNCSCSPQCLYSVFREITSSDKSWDSGVFTLPGSIKYLVQPPKIRYTREIVFHFQDLVVSFGGAAGLFLGASFISFVEILYFMLEKVLSALFVRRGLIQAEQVKKATFEEQRIMELTKILEHTLFDQ